MHKNKNNSFSKTGGLENCSERLKQLLCMCMRIGVQILKKQIKSRWTWNKVANEINHYQHALVLTERSCLNQSGEGVIEDDSDHPHTRQHVYALVCAWVCMYTEQGWWWIWGFTQALHVEYCFCLIPLARSYCWVTVTLVWITSVCLCVHVHLCMCTHVHVCVHSLPGLTRFHDKMPLLLVPIESQESEDLAS